MKYLNSIQEIHKEFETTGSHPVEVLCAGIEGMGNYICKYSPVPANRLFREFLANQFLLLWGIKAPEAVFVNIEEEHIPNNLSDRVQPRFFRIPTFGVRSYKDAKEVDEIIKGFSDYFVNQIDRIDLLKIALFDLWLGNEDRHQGNYNLLIVSGQENTSPYFMPIDHTEIFNSGNIEYEITMLNFEETLIYSDVFAHFCKMSPKLLKEIDQIIVDFKKWTTSCNDSLNKILADVPEKWEIDIQFIKSYLEKYIFLDQWLKNVENTYRKYIQQRLS